MTESSDLIESLLYQSEGTALDFKKEQYPFIGTTDEKKSELLKDLLAFANSWRQGDAYIVIGVEAVVGGRHIPIGTEEHFDDAQLQQFVNYITNRKIELSYEVHLFEGKKIGIVRIPKQKPRPFYATRRYGKVEKEFIYYRLGSSTAIAKPEDIARMGREDSIQSPPTPSLILQFADLERRTELGSSIELRSIAYKIPTVGLPNAGEKRGGLLDFPDSLREVNRNYWREKEEYVRVRGLVRPVGFIIRNQSSTLAEKVRVEIEGSSSDGLTVIDDSDLPYKPAYHCIDKIPDALRKIRPQWREGRQTDVTHHENRWNITVGFGNVQPKSSAWATSQFYIGSTSRDYLELEATIYADNLPEPQKTTLTIRFAIEKKPTLTVALLQKLPPFTQ